MSKYVEREILNHKRLIHPHIVQLKEVSRACLFALRCPFKSTGHVCALTPLSASGSCHVSCMTHSSPGQSPGRTWLQVFLTNNHLAIAMEYAAGGNLYQLVARSGGLPEPDARWYFQQLIFAIDYCHKMVRSLVLSERLLSIPLSTRNLVLQSTKPIRSRMKSTIQGLHAMNGHAYR